MLALISAFAMLPSPAPLWATFEGKSGPGRGKRIVLLTGDEEYRSEECMTQLAKILAERHGFHCDVIYSVAPDGTIDPNIQNNMPGIELLDRADLALAFLRFRNLPDEQMVHFDKYMRSGKPIIGFRTATHAFQVPADRRFAAHDWQSKTWPGGFGRQVLGETWISHHGNHLVESTLTQRAPGANGHPILQGVDPIWVPSDVYEVHPPADAKPLLLGTVLRGMRPTDPPLRGPKNDPLMPVVWTRQIDLGGKKKTKVVASTLGSGPDFQDENLRRLAINSCFWSLGMKVPSRADATIVGTYDTTWIGFNKAKKGVRPGEF